MALLVAKPVDFLFQFLDSGLGTVGPVAFALVLVGQNGSAVGRVVPDQLAVLPARIEVQRGAVTLQAVVGELYDENGFVATLHQPFAGQLGALVLAGFVEPPVFGDAQGSAVVPFGAGVDVGRAL